MCECLEQIGDAVRAKGFDGLVSGTLINPRRATIEFVPMPGVRKKRGWPVLIASYCPFCGERYEQPHEGQQEGDRASDYRPSDGTFAIPGQSPNPSLDRAISRLKTMDLSTCGVCGETNPVFRIVGRAIWWEGKLTPWMCPDCAKKDER